MSAYLPPNRASAVVMAMGGNAVNPSLEARAAPSMARTVPPMAMTTAPALPRRMGALMRRGAVVGTPRVEPGAPGTPGRAKSATSMHAQCVGLRPELDFRDRARQDVAPGAAMDGFTAFPEIQFRAGLHAAFMRSCSILRMARAFP
jgi:hypothetical protein